MPEDETPTNAIDETNATEDTAQAVPQDEPTENPVEETPEAQVEVAEPTEETPTEPDFDINEYWNERYNGGQNQVPPQASPDLVEQLNNLPTDENGTADPESVSKVLQDFQSQTIAKAEASADARARDTAIGLAQEQAQQVKLIEKYPQVAKDRSLMENIFDLRDASALRGKNISLQQAAERLFKREENVRTEASQAATKTKEVQAAAHLETSSTTANSQSSSKQQLYEQATRGSGQQAADARHQLLKDEVEKMFS